MKRVFEEEEFLGLHGRLIPEEMFPKRVLTKTSVGDRIFNNKGVELYRDLDGFKLISNDIREYITKEDIKQSKWNLIL